MNFQQLLNQPTTMDMEDQLRHMTQRKLIINKLVPVMSLLQAMLTQMPLKQHMLNHRHELQFNRK